MSVVPPATQSKHMQENNTMSSSNGGAALGTTQPIDTTFIMWRRNYEAQEESQAHEIDDQLKLTCIFKHFN